MTPELKGRTLKTVGFRIHRWGLELRDLGFRLCLRPGNEPGSRLRIWDIGFKFGGFKAEIYPVSFCCFTTFRIRRSFDWFSNTSKSS